MLDAVEHQGVDFTVTRDGREIARITPIRSHTVGAFLARREGSAPVDDDFEADALAADMLLTANVSNPWDA
jgi:antitoxin (DNA-binding transcriptional repressor) of toxin-antitoxin stability system